MGWSDVRYCFAMAILVIILIHIKYPKQSLGDLLFLHRFLLLLLLGQKIIYVCLLSHVKKSRVGRSGLILFFFFIIDKTGNSRSRFRNPIPVFNFRKFR